MKLTQEMMIRAIKERDINFDGKFYYGVTSTKIYCIPSCGSKKPSTENLRLFKSREEAQMEGYRACKRCKPDTYPNNEPEWFKNVITLMLDHIHERIKEKDLSHMAGVDISTINRFFKKHFGITPLKYHRKMRLKRAKHLINNGISSKKAAKMSGFKSMSGFRDAYLKEYENFHSRDNKARLKY